MSMAEYTRKELAAIAGVTEHLIHKYIKLRLLPGCATGQTRWCRYDDRHLRRIRLIQKLHNPEHTTLKELRPKLEEMAFR